MITVKRGSLEYLTAPNINIPHAFTTRLGGVSEGIFASLNIALHRGDLEENVERNYEILADALGFDLESLVLTRQTHSDIVRVVTKNDARGIDHRNYPECDALITNDAGCALVVFTADCTPILLFDQVTGAVGAVHAGWRGTVYDIAGKTVLAMRENFGCEKCGKAALTDRMGTRFPMVREYPHRNIIFNSAPTYMGDKKDELQRNSLYCEHFVFSTERGVEIINLIKKYNSSQALGGAVRRMGKRDSK